MAAAVCSDELDGSDDGCTTASAMVLSAPLCADRALDALLSLRNTSAASVRGAIAVPLLGNDGQLEFVAVGLVLAREARQVVVGEHSALLQLEGALEGVCVIACVRAHAGTYPVVNGRHGLEHVWLALCVNDVRQESSDKVHLFEVNQTALELIRQFFDEHHIGEIDALKRNRRQRALGQRAAIRGPVVVRSHQLCAE